WTITCAHSPPSRTPSESTNEMSRLPGRATLPLAELSMTSFRGASSKGVSNCYQLNIQSNVCCSKYVRSLLSALVEGPVVRNKKDMFEGLVLMLRGYRRDTRNPSKQSWFPGIPISWFSSGTTIPVRQFHEEKFDVGLDGYSRMLCCPAVREACRHTSYAGSHNL